MNTIPYRTCFAHMRPRAGYYYDDIDIPRLSGQAVRDRIGELSGDARISIPAFDDRLREAFDAATGIATREVLCPQVLIEKLIEGVPWLEGLDTVTVGHCLDYFYRARESYMDKFPPNEYRPGGQTDPDSAQALDKFCLATTAWSVLDGMNGLIDLPVRPFEIEEGHALEGEWVDETDESDSDDDDIIQIVGVQQQRQREQSLLGLGRLVEEEDQMELDRAAAQTYGPVEGLGSSEAGAGSGQLAGAQDEMEID